MKLKHPAELLQGVDYKLVLDFFALFSRFEHAMKCYGYKRQDRQGNVAPDWYTLANEYAGRLSAIGSASLNKSIDFLNLPPPKKQTINLRWEKRESSCDDQDSNAIIFAKDVRNNLFHGGKYADPNPERDELLIKSATAVIKGCLLVNQDLWWWYEYCG